MGFGARSNLLAGLFVLAVSLAPSQLPIGSFLPTRKGGRYLHIWTAELLFMLLFFLMPAAPGLPWLGVSFFWWGNHL